MSSIELPPEGYTADGAKLGGWWHRAESGDRIVCQLCPRYCSLKPGDRGFCFVRQNIEGQMALTTYGRSTGFCIDPIEKKPLNQFYPGTSVLSFGTAGCNLGCKFCQNWSISKSREVELLSENATPEMIAEAALRLGCRSVAFTYNDPVIWAEYAIDTARECRARGIKTVAVTAGYITREARAPFYDVMDAANVDLKGFTEEFYQKLTLSHLEPVLENLRWLKEETPVWFEVTNLMIPQANDSRDEVTRMCDWLIRNLGPDVPIHFTAFHPDFKMRDRPNTPPATLQMAREIARRAGLRYVYTGNVDDVSGQSTYCPGCGQVVIERNWYALGRYAIAQGKCQSCGTAIAGHYDDVPGNWGRRREPVRISNYAAAPARREPTSPLISIAAPAKKERTGGFQVSNIGEAESSAIHQAACKLVAAEVCGHAYSLEPALQQMAAMPVEGVFVTLKRRGRLRGCCGFLGRTIPLGEGLAHSAARSATGDVRFPPVTPEELPHLELDVSILHGMKRVEGPARNRANAIEVGRHGLQLFLGENRPLLLPQVATEAGWNAEEFLQHVCLKGGLPATTWQDDAAQLYTFEGLVIERPTHIETCREAASPLLGASVVRGYADFCRQNIDALLIGATPNYYALHLPEGEIAGMALIATIPAANVTLTSQQMVLRNRIPLQGTLFQLCQALAAQLQQVLERLPRGTPWQLELALFDQVALHGTLAEPDLAGFDPQRRALLLVEQDRSAWSYLPSGLGDEALADAREALGSARPRAVALYSLQIGATSAPLRFGQRQNGSKGQATRPPGVAGRFYPGDAAELNKMVDGLLAGEPVNAESWPAVMVPHAGLIFSGRIAAQTLRRVKIPGTVLIIGPKHTNDGVSWAIAPHAAWSIPGAILAGDAELAKQLAESVPGLVLDAAAHAREHSIEVELPLLARLNPAAKIVALAIGNADYDDCRQLGEKLADVLADRRDDLLVVISSDMNHFATDAENRRLDEVALKSLETLDTQQAFETIVGGHISMCGVRPAIIAMEMLRRWGGLTKTERTFYGTSSETSGDTSRVVGYAGMLLR